MADNNYTFFSYHRLTLSNPGQAIMIQVDFSLEGEQLLITAKRGDYPTFNEDKSHDWNFLGLIPPSMSGNSE